MQDISLYQILDLKDQISKKELELEDARRRVESEYIRINLIQNTYNRRKALEERMQKIEEVVQFIIYLKNEPELMQTEIDNLKKSVDQIKMLKSYTKAVNAGDVSKIKKLNELQDIVNKLPDVDTIKRKIQNLSNGYNNIKNIAEIYFKNNRLTVDDYIEMYKAIKNGMEYISLSKYREPLNDMEYLRLKKIQDTLQAELIQLEGKLEGWETKRKKIKAVGPDRYLERSVF
jgi:cysteinyl-tRNA synthetase